ncbi:MAG: Fe-S protein assembly co-chaperone HscB [Candidatus Berkiella sp.]
MLSSHSDFFTLFGLEKKFSQELSQIKTRFYQLQQTVHPDKFVNAPISDKRAAMSLAATINEAYQVLCTPLKRAIYLLKIQGVDIQSETDTTMSADFLMEQISLRERLGEGEGQTLKDDIDSKLKACEHALSKYLDKQQSEDLQGAREVVRQMQFYVRLIQEYEDKPIS